MDELAPSKSDGFLDANGFHRLSQIRKDLQKNGSEVKNEPINSAQDVPVAKISNRFTTAAAVPGAGKPAVSKIPPPTEPELALLNQRFERLLDMFVTKHLIEPCTFHVSDFVRLLIGELFSEADPFDTDGLIRDLLVHNHVAFLKCLDHPNWQWKPLFETDQLRTVFLEDIVPVCGEPEAKVLLTRMALRMYSLAIMEEASSLADDFLHLVVELCRLVDFPSIFMWTFVGLLASEEIQPYLKGGVCQVQDFSTERDFSLYEENSRHLNAPSLLRFRPEPRELKFTPSGGIIPAAKRKKLRTITIKVQQARRNQALALDVLSLCCEMFTLPNVKALSPKTGTVASVQGEANSQDSPASPKPDDSSPSSPPPDATGMPQESPASPDLPEMRTSKSLDEKLPERFRVEYKEGLMKMFLLPSDSDSDKKPDGRPTYGTIKRALYALGGWHWLAACLIDTLKPEESDKAVWWPEFQAVAFFNRNVHIVNAFKKNPIWMVILEGAASSPDAFLYYSPLLRPVYISLYTHWETSMEGPTSARNIQAREQTLWLLRCLSKSKLIHEPYCYLGGILDNMSAHEISSALASLWKVIKTYMPNPHGLLYIPENEQDFRARQMAETDCLLKIRAVIYSKLSSMGVIARKFFTIARVPLEESRWYESKESQETASAPAPLDTSHLEKVD